MTLRQAVMAILMLLVAWVLAIPQVYAAESAQQTLDEYIDTQCSRHCVTPNKLIEAVALASFANELDPSLLLAVIRVESAFNTRASNLGNVGLTQTLLRYHRPKYRGRNVYDVHANVEVGSSILRDCLKSRRQNLDKALRCYNGNADPKYPTKVRAAMREIRRLAL